MRHKRILFEQIDYENQKKDEKRKSRRIKTYNITIALLSVIGKVCATVIITLVGSILLTALLSSVSNNCTYTDSLYLITNEILHFFRLV